MDEAENKHPKSAPAHEPARIRLSFNCETGQPLLALCERQVRHLQGEFSASRPDVGARPADHHRHEAETEEDGKERIRPVVHEEPTHQNPPSVGEARLGLDWEEHQPNGNVRHGDEQEHEAARDIWRGVARGIGSGERRC